MRHELALHIRKFLPPLLSIGLLALAGWALSHELRPYYLREVVDAFHALPRVALWKACGLTALSYLVMTGYDALALRYVGHRLPYRNIGLASFIGYTFSNNIGLSMFAGASVRYRLYSAWGLAAEKITAIVFFCTLTLWLGFLAVGGLLLTMVPLTMPAGFFFSRLSPRLLGLMLLLPVLAYLVAGALRRLPAFGRLGVEAPPAGLLLWQLLIASADWVLAGSVLFVLLPDSAPLGLAACLAMYMLAQLAGLVSQVPGGLGVFETVFMLLAARLLPAPQALATLFAYRAVYYLGPFVLAILLLAVHEIAPHRAYLRRLLAGYLKWEPAILVPFLSLGTFIAGAILLFSGAVPTLNGRLLWLEEVLPLASLELSHFFGSCIGMVLLLLSMGIRRRLDGAYWLTVVLLGAGMVTSMLKGLDYEETSILGLVLIALVPSRRHFYRKASLLSQRFTPSWLVGVGTVCISMVWLGLFSHKHVEYAYQLWWQFAFDANAPRFLRSTAGVAVVLLLFAVARLLHPTPPRPALADSRDLERAQAIVNASPNASDQLVLLGDKGLLFNQTRTAFIMFGVAGRSWVAMGDPVGPPREWPELIWQFRELSDAYGGWTVFYEVGPEHLYHYLDLGLTVTKVGETARVPLSAFSLEGANRKGLRHIFHKLNKDGFRFEIVPKAAFSDLLPAISDISQAWLLDKKTREKGFSLGYFKEDYLRRFDTAVVKRGEEIIAFANIWQGSDQEELSIDLMRFHPAKSPTGVMDFLLLNLILWGKQAGFRWFTLGLAPLAGLEGRSLSPHWHRLAAFVARRGGYFYNFQGIRQYKQKFGPVWEPRYLVAPGGAALPQILANLASLIAGGWKGVVAK